jgi:hypothetical protein
MILFWRFLFSRETRVYLRWRLGRGLVSGCLVPFEWLGLILRSRLAKHWPHRTNPSSPERTAGSARAPDFKGFFFQPVTIQRQAALYRSQFPEDVDALLRCADRVAEGRLDLASGIEFLWTEGNWKPKTDDREHYLALQRWGYLVTLGKAWVYTRDPRYPEACRRILSDWIRCHPPRPGHPAWESYSVSERLVHACLTMAFLWDAPEFQSETFPLLYPLLEKHAAWLGTHLESRPGDNHLINNGRALYVYGRVFHQEAYRSLGWDILMREFPRQIASDGMLGEQSIPYHLLLTRTALEVYLLSRSEESAAPAFFAALVTQMLQVAASCVRPDGSVPLVGDVSPDIPLANLVGMVAAGCRLLGLPTPYPIPMIEHAAWFIGDTPEKLETAQPQPPLLHLPQSGFGLFASPRMHVTFHSDPRGEVSRHGHADALGVTLWAHGQEILTDSGVFSYRSDAWWDYFRGAAGHNVVLVDQLPPFPVTDFLSSFYATAYRQAHSFLLPPVQRGPFWLLEAGHSGYARLREPLKARRRMIIGPDYLWITDWISGGLRPHHFQALWHWGLGSYEPGEKGFGKVALDGNEGIATAWQKDGHPIHPRWVQGQRTPVIQGWHSSAYGMKKPAAASIVEGYFSDALRLDLWVSGDPALQLHEFIPDIGKPGLIATSKRIDHFAPSFFESEKPPNTADLLNSEPRRKPHDV